jgi:hypothetical protein
LRRPPPPQPPGCTASDQCCSGFHLFATPACNGGANHTHGGGFWTASGAGVVLLPEGDDDVRFNSIPFRTNLLWHHGHGRLIEPDCE